MNIDSVLDEVTRYLNAKKIKSKRLEDLTRLVREGKATYTQANEFALELGNLLSQAYKVNLPIETLFTYDEASRLINKPMRGVCEEIADYCEKVQGILNKRAGLGIKAIPPPIEAERIDGIAKAISEAETAEKAASVFEETVITLSQHMVDSSVRENAKFHDSIGLKPQIIRKYEGGHFRRGKFVDCKWCKSLAGVYDYAEVSNKGNDVYRRHEGCRCTVEYIPTKGSKQDVWTKQRR